MRVVFQCALLYLHIFEFTQRVRIELILRSFVIEGVACKPPLRLQATPPLQTSLIDMSSFSRYFKTKNLGKYKVAQYNFSKNGGAKKIDCYLKYDFNPLCDFRKEKS